MKLDDKLIQTLQEIYYSPNFLMGGYNKLLREVKKRGIDVTNDQLKYFYNSQETVQIFRPYHKQKRDPDKAGKIVTFFPFQSLYIDTMFIHKYKMLLVNAIDQFTRYGFSKVFRYNRGESGDENNVTVTSDKTAQALYEFQLFINELGYKIKSCVHDPGSEFLGSFKTYLEENNIKNITTDINDKHQTSPVERFNGSIRLLIEKCVSVYGSKDLIGKIPDIVQTYNNSYHSGIGYTPSEALTNKDVQQELKDNNKEVVSLDIPNALKVGNQVRLYIKKEDDKFNKLSPNWSKELYIVESYNKRNGKYKVNGKLYTENQLQKVENVIPFEPSKTKKAKKQARELANIQDYLSAPAPEPTRRVTRSRAKNVD